MADETEDGRSNSSADSSADDDPFVYPLSDESVEVGESDDILSGTASKGASTPSEDTEFSSSNNESNRTVQGTGGTEVPNRTVGTEAKSTGSGQASEKASARTYDKRSGDQGTKDVGWIARLWATDEGAAIYVRDVLTSVVAVLLVGLVLFAVSGIWPPMVAVESGSMESNMYKGDLVFVVDNDRFIPDGAPEYRDGSTGIVPADRATESGRSKFGGPGDVIVFRPNGRTETTPVIHRAMLWVEDGENWYDRADRDAVGSASTCEELDHCPAPHSGFVTKGDNQRTNSEYDQASSLSAPVRLEWILGTAELRLPYLGHIRLTFSGQVAHPFNTSVTASDMAEQMI